MSIGYGAEDPDDEVGEPETAASRPDRPDVMTTRHNLAELRGRTGDPAGAAAELEALLADRIRVLGPDHPETLVTRGNVAGWLGEAGDAATAAARYTELLADRLRVLGPGHPATLLTQRNAMRWHGAAQTEDNR